MVTVEQYKDWLAHTDARPTFISEHISHDLSKRNALNTIVTEESTASAEETVPCTMAALSVPTRLTLRAYLPPRTLASATEVVAV